MIYIVTIVLLLILIFKYDLASNYNVDRRNLYYKILLVWFICVSGFAYNVGSDVPSYMYEYDEALWTNLSFKDLLSTNDQRQLGWVLTESICHIISSDFWLFKMVLAIFLNCAVFRFVKRHSSYPFLSILFYALILYLHLNFNALRQSAAVGFFLVGYDYLVDKKWGKYFFYAFLAYMFHSSAIVLFVFPLLSFLKINKKSLLFSAFILIAIITVSITFNLRELIYNLFIMQGGDMAEGLTDRAELYMNANVISGRDYLSVNGIIYALIRVTIYAFIMALALKSEEAKHKIDMPFYFIFLVFFILMQFSVPIVFFRLLFYVQFFYICFLPSAIVQVGKQFSEIRQFACVVLILIFMYGPIKDLTRDTEKTGLPLICQYAPYYSIFNPQIDPVRNANFGSHR